MAGFTFPAPTTRLGSDVPGFLKSESGLLIPQDAAITVLEKARKLNRLSAGLFFSDWARMSGYNSTGAMEKPDDEVGYSFLRDSYTHSEIDQLIINRRIMQMRQLAARCVNPDSAPGWRVVHERYDDPNYTVTESDERRCREVEEIIRHPASSPMVRSLYPSGFESILTIATREDLTIDRKVFILARDRRGRVRDYWMVDGATILPIVQVLYPFMKKDLKDEDALRNPWSIPTDKWLYAAERFSEDEERNPHHIDLTRYAYVQEVDATITAAWTEDEISVDVRQPSTWINKLPYGQGSLLQQSLSLTAAWVNEWQYNMELFRTNIPENIVALFGDYDPNGLESAKRMLFSEAGPGSWHRTVFLPADPDYKIQVDKLRATPQEAQFLDLMKLTTLLKLHVYGMNPKYVDITGVQQKRMAAFSMRSPGRSRAEDELDEYSDIGARSLIQGIADWIDRSIVKSWYPDLKFIFDGFKRQSERERIELTAMKVDKYMTINEAREIENLQPLPSGIGDYPLTIATALLKSEADLIEAESERAVMMGEAPGSEGAGSGKPDQGPDGKFHGRKPGAEARKPSGGLGRPEKDATEPGESRRVRDRAKRDVRRKTGYVGEPREMVRRILTEQLDRDTKNPPNPARARENYRRRGKV